MRHLERVELEHEAGERGEQPDGGGDGGREASLVKLQLRARAGILLAVLVRQQVLHLPRTAPHHLQSIRGAPRKR
jgi:hypothetical protein